MFYSAERFNAYRIMWVIVMFDLPTETPENRRRYADFRKRLQKDGFMMFQYSIYARHCASREKADVHIGRVKKWLPVEGQICIMCITDKQFGELELYDGCLKRKNPHNPQQLELF
ncbi:CRISPR-associated protein Cas2 [Flexibacter flexilis DSM 6793]|uniref:CRISPR-associated endoribonuclease Cas2 n=1 Tax=Flexibacter flexilis DSM 6793 TaxID=927664 RepID=A0A1I1LE20_9BACT|nr:CRISPR-associated endonuclease Cas2 [Flexibacter flexilis]SFC70762.1 CRISPR-associated protein Cas2 [Flexibacter flexilis DSM 6793]